MFSLTSASVSESYKVHRCALGPDAELQQPHEEVAAKVTYWVLLRRASLVQPGEAVL